MSVSPETPVHCESHEGQCHVCGDVAVVGRTLAVEVQSGHDFSVLVQAAAQVDLGPRSSAEVRIPLTASLPPGVYPVFLVTEGQPSLDRATLRVGDVRLVHRGGLELLVVFRALGVGSVVRRRRQHHVLVTSRLP